MVVDQTRERPSMGYSLPLTRTYLGRFAVVSHRRRKQLPLLGDALQLVLAAILEAQI